MATVLPPALPGAWSELSRRPGIRTLHSARFRIVLAAFVWLFGLAMWAHLALILLSGSGFADPPDVNLVAQYGLDFADYRTASLRMLEGRSPYAPEMLSGPIPAQGVDRYRYPPPFAQLLTPIAILPFRVAATVWLVLQAGMLFAGCWYAASAGGARRSLERFVWTGASLTWFLPVFAMLWLGNVGAPLALAVGLLLGGRNAVGRGLLGGALGAGAMVLKVAPLTLAPALVRAGGRPAIGLLGGLAFLVVPSVALAPLAWSEYLRVVPNLLAGDATYANNLAPATVLLNLGAPALLIDALRVASILLAAVLILASIWLAPRPGGWPAAVGCGVAAALLLPAALWYHYLVLLLPLAFFAWPRVTPGARLALLGSAGLVSVGQAVLPLASLGGFLLGATSIASLLRRRASSGAESIELRESASRRR